jgi:hypothetical protein
MTRGAGGACIRASKKAGLKEFLVTMWGDDGGYCDYDSALAGLTWLAELAYGDNADPKRLQRRYAGICHSDFAVIDAPTQDLLSDCALMWDDPILGIHFHNQELREKNGWNQRSRKFARLLATFRKTRLKTTSGGDIAYGIALAEFLKAKIDLALKLKSAYAQRNTRQLASVARDAGAVMKLLDKLDAAFRRQWLRRNKPFGLEVMQIRFAGQRRRYRELVDRIGQLLKGEIGRIDEMENRPKEPLENVNMSSTFRHVAVGSTIY